MSKAGVNRIPREQFLATTAGDASAFDPASSQDVDSSESNVRVPEHGILAGSANLDPATALAPVEQKQRDAEPLHLCTSPMLGNNETILDPALDASNLESGQDPAASNAASLSSGVKGAQPSKALTQLYTVTYLIFFSFLGTLARLGLTALTTYPGAPVIFGIIWPNVSGSLIMGFLIEDRKLFRHEWGKSTQRHDPRAMKKNDDDAESRSDVVQKKLNLAAAKKAHLAVKKTIPLYVGLATGFCGSFTSFSSFMRDMFLAASNNLVDPGQTSLPSRSGGYSFMAMLAVLIATVALCLSALTVGGHLAAAVERITPSVPFRLLRRFMDPLSVVLGCGCWLGAVFLAIFPPHDAWRGQVIFSLVFAPLGTLLRFYLALYLNGRIASFPLGTFVANALGTAVLGMGWDLAHANVGGVVGCQVLQGLEDGFCGCLTTVSTWVAEMSSLRRRSAWVYGSTSVVASFLLLIAIMGGLRWSEGFHPLSCVA